MSWFGKLMGGSVGFMFGGPIGALVGVSLGHALIDDKVRAGYAERGNLTNQEQRQTVFFTVTFALLAKMAKADGRVCESEIAAVRCFMQDKLRLNSALQQFATTVFNEAKENNTPFEEYARQFGEVFQADPQIRMMLYEMLFTVALADDVLHPAEDAMLRAAPGLLGLSGKSYETVRRQFVSDLSHHYAMLGLEDGASQTEVKKAYRKLANEYHPDKVIAKGLPEDFVEFAEGKFREINEAYEAISQAEKR
ncbi:MAG: TerB family tellurite resistance protein [Desulfuromonadales bacterium]|nr:TerB family tellurite resistance protein [Desulfuromonadales bacterium]